jgi:hypothetical protein
MASGGSSSTLASTETRWFNAATARAALRLMRKLLKKQGCALKMLGTDTLRSGLRMVATDGK